MKTGEIALAILGFLAVAYVLYAVWQYFQAMSAADNIVSTIGSSL
jgi:lipopolysaccharide export LptBFGC system permease protein LptF